MQGRLLGLATLALVVLALVAHAQGVAFVAVAAWSATLPVLLPEGIAAPIVPLAGVVACGFWVGAWVWRRRRAPRTTPSPTDTEARLRAAALLTTARRAWSPLAPGSMRAVLWDVRGRRTVALVGRHWTFGSDAACALCAEGEGIAPLHARLSATGDGLTITSLDAEGSTRLGLAERVLHTGVAVPLPEGELVLLGRSLRLMVERVSVTCEHE